MEEEDGLIVRRLAKIRIDRLYDRYGYQYLDLIEVKASEDGAFRWRRVHHTAHPPPLSQLSPTILQH
ncbi:hypothetical protein AAT19DRAFT_14792 [Rhodotorula toruloides]|uniref:Uncharacterized protein n=1 Tax=Rhodotorula toruloides TaxID=5286 RepID=A0A2T0A8Z3_RHOTO|nr:hypothetical protein AAT19DRAFT_14792 [Rhodotorula toruloides]